MIAAPKGKCLRTTAQIAKQNTDSEILEPGEKIGNRALFDKQSASGCLLVDEINPPIPASIFIAKSLTPRPRKVVVSADVKLTHRAEVKLTHLGDDGSL